LVEDASDFSAIPCRDPWIQDLIAERCHGVTRYPSIGDKTMRMHAQTAVIENALGAFAPILPASSMASGAAVAVCFSPEEDCAAFAVRAINNAEREILVGAYGLTTGSGIVEALVRAKERGVDVRLIADRTTPCERESGIEPLAAVGVPIWIDAQARIATMVIDSAVTLAGSMNWTATNSEDLNLVSSPAVAAAYTVHWRDRLGVSSPFIRREDWCRMGSVT
jgi:phosphatidylserine/phosphatidylglycerophosphate/cardiolipin synthase-like enzyme